MKGLHPTISVITVALNAADTIRDCIDSVRNQHYQAQHIIVDGGSTDGTVSIVKKYAPPTASVISEPDKGLYDAMNKGLVYSAGDAVAILNADDFYPHRNVLSRIADVLSRPGVEACYGDLVYVDRSELSKVVRYWRAGEYDSSLFYRGWMPPHPTFVARRFVYERYGGYNLALGSSADYELMLRFLLRYGVIAEHIPEVLVIMRTGGVSNVNLWDRCKANRLDRMAWKVNALRPRPWTLMAKPLSKAAQFVIKNVDNAQWMGSASLRPGSALETRLAVMAGEVRI